ncbi:MAG: flagellar basal body P-ring formation protein FlgA [Desulfobulbaceae bacterium]|nr:flagellar basal body P-ring formation protein FlgA [Desulfobulbaceae bacterium]
MRVVKGYISLAGVLLALVFFPPLSSADGRQVKVLGQDTFQKFFLEIILEKAPWPAENIRIENFSTTPQTLTVPSGALGYRTLRQPHAAYLGKKALALMFLVDGKECGEVKMSGDLQLYDDVVCVKRRLSRHTILQKNDLKVVHRNVSMLGADFIRDPGVVIGKRLKTSMRAGGLLYAKNLEASPLVKRGDLVTIVARSADFTITTPGQVRSPGAAGEIVKIKNLMSRREIYAKVVTEDQVEVDF